MESKQITGISVDEKIVKVSFNYKKNSNIISDIYSLVKKENINYRLLNYSNGILSFVIGVDDLHIFDSYYTSSIDIYEKNDNLCNISLVGLGFTSSPQLSISILDFLEKNNIKIDQLCASNLSFSFLIEKSDLKKTVDLLIDKYNI